MRPFAQVFCAALLTAPGAFAGNAALAKAEQEMEKHQYKPAEKALTTAVATLGNDRDTLIKILEDQGVVAGFLNQPDRARSAFRSLLALDPHHALSRDYAPRVTEPFKEAQNWAEAHGSLKFDAVFGAPTGGPKLTMQVALTADPLKMAKKVRFHYRPGKGPFKIQVAPAHPVVKFEVKARTLEWWAELLGEPDAVLAQIASGAKPIRIVPEAPQLVELVAPAPPPQTQSHEEFAPLVPPVPRPANPEPPVATTSQPPPDLSNLPIKPRELHLPPPVALEPGFREPTAVARTSISTSGLRIASYVALAAAVGAGAGGAYFGVQANGARSKVIGATQDQRGVVVSMKQTDAYALDATVRKDAPLANALIGAAAGLAAAGVTLWWLGRDTAVSAGPSGLMVSGVFR